MSLIERKMPPIIQDISRLLVRLKIYRLGKQVTQEQLASDIGISIRTFQRLEQGLAPLEMSILYKICEALKVPYESLAGPTYTQEDIPNVFFFEKIDDIKIEQNPLQIQQAFEGTLTHLKNGTHQLANLYKAPVFNNNPLELFYSSPSFTWCNTSLRESSKPSSSVKILSVKSLSDYEFIIRLFEVCYKLDNPWFLSTTKHDQNGKKIKVTTLNNFHLFEGLPLNFGAVVKREIL